MKNQSRTWFLIIVSVIMLIVVTGCSNSPQDAALDATIQAAVDGAIESVSATYESRLNGLVHEDTLDTSQQEQNREIQQYIADQIVLAKTEMADTVPTKAVQTTPTFSTDDKLITPQAQIQNGPCDDRFSYVMDITVPDGSDIPRNTIFYKTWYIKNEGTCTWNSNYKLVYNSGAEVGTKKSYDILKSGEVLKPGESKAITAELTAPNTLNIEYATNWAIQSDKGETFGSGTYQNVFLKSSFVTSADFNFVKNFSSAICSDDSGYFTCGTTDGDGRGYAYYDPSPTLESRRTGQPSFVIAPPAEMGGTSRLEFGPIRMPVGSWFYTNFCCRPETPGCDVNIRLYVREPGHPEVLVEEIREWDDGFMGEWKFTMSSREQFDQDLYYIFEVQANGMGDRDDQIIFQNTRLY